MGEFESKVILTKNEYDSLRKEILDLKKENKGIKEGDFLNVTLTVDPESRHWHSTKNIHVVGNYDKVILYLRSHIDTHNSTNDRLKDELDSLQCRFDKQNETVEKYSEQRERDKETIFSLDAFKFHVLKFQDYLAGATKGDNNG